MTDIVERLRIISTWESGPWPISALVDAADEIERLREALGECLNLAGAYVDEKDAIDWVNTIAFVARAALAHSRPHRGCDQ